MHCVLTITRSYNLCARALPYRCCRHITRQSPPSQWRSGPPAPNNPVELDSPIYDQNFARPTLHTFDVFRRFAKFSIIGTVALGVATWTAFEGAHLWVENVELAAEKDEELRQWGWSREAEAWSGGSSGGTDPALGIKARHAIRSAWIAQHWGTGPNHTTSESASSAGKPGSVVEARLAYAHDFLNLALTSAFEKAQQEPGLHPRTIPELLSRHANILERIGTKSTLIQARSEYERVWASLPPKDDEAPRVALKLGDLCSRLGDSQEAIDWWSRALSLTDGSRGRAATDTRIILPETLPTSPLSQRIISSVLTSLSAHYAQTGQLDQAKLVEETGLRLLEVVGLPETKISIPPPQQLHQLFLLHRSSLLSLHLGEVAYALTKDAEKSLSHLKIAAEASELIAFDLCGLSHGHQTGLATTVPQPGSSDMALLPAYLKSRTMKKPASALLRDARRSAAEAWNLTGLLVEGKGGSPQRAMECYRRALDWAGATADSDGGIDRAGEGILEKEWRAMWDNYVRIRDTVRQKKS